MGTKLTSLVVHIKTTIHSFNMKNKTILDRNEHWYRLDFKVALEERFDNLQALDCAIVPFSHETVDALPALDHVRCCFTTPQLF